MDYLVEAHSKQKKQFIEAILPSIIEQLGLTNTRKSLVMLWLSNLPCLSNQLVLHWHMKWFMYVKWPKVFLKLRMVLIIGAASDIPNELSIWISLGNKMRLLDKS